MAVLHTEYSIEENRGTVHGDGVVARIACRLSSRLHYHPFLIEAVWLQDTSPIKQNSNRTTIRLSREEAETLVQELNSLLKAQENS